jgi:hypothetical protein
METESGVVADDAGPASIGLAKSVAAVDLNQPY